MAKGDLYELRFRNIYRKAEGDHKSIALMRGTFLLDTGVEKVGEDSRGERYIQMYSLSERMLVWVRDYECPMDMRKIG